MICVRESAALHQYLDQQRKLGQSIGFVPTMGALHQGHLSLVASAKAECDLAVVSIFVNPTQFNEKGDFDRYPRDEQQDLRLLEYAKADVVFLPDSQEMYGKSTALLDFNFEGLDTVMEGKLRPGHFKGVVTIVDKFFSLVKPDVAYFGQKDFQQLAIVRLLARRLHPDIRIVGCSILREPNGLAMSSRNELLSGNDRAHASVLFRALSHISKHWKPEHALNLREEALSMLTEENVQVEYLEIADYDSLQPFNSDTGNKAVACLAARYGAVRLIDNVVLPEQH